MAHYGVNINGVDTLEQYGLMLLEDIKAGSPEFKETRVDIPGMSGTLNLSYAVTGRPTFGDREISFSLFKRVNDTALDVLRTRLRALWHGREVKLILPFDKSHYYAGVMEIGESSGYNSGKIPVTMTAEPYKYDLAASDEEWLWDPFNFEVDVGRRYKALEVGGEAAYTIIGSPMPVCPSFIVTGGALIMTINGSSYSLPVGTSTVLGLWLEDGEYSVTFTGTGAVTISFQGGYL